MQTHKQTQSENAKARETLITHKIKRDVVTDNNYIKGHKSTILRLNNFQEAGKGGKYPLTCQSRFRSENEANKDQMVDSAMLSRLLRLFWSPLRNFSSEKILTWPYVIAGSISSPKDHDHCDRAVKINDTCLLTKWQGRAGKSLAWRHMHRLSAIRAVHGDRDPNIFPFGPA